MTTFGLNAAVKVVKARDQVNIPTELNKVIHSYTSVTRSMIEYHCENFCSKNSGTALGRLPTSYYGAEPYDAAKQALISQHCLRSKILVLWINNSLTTEDKLKLRAFRTSCTFNNQYDRSTMFSFVVKILPLDTRSGCSDIKTKLEDVLIQERRLQRKSSYFIVNE